MAGRKKKKTSGSMIKSLVVVVIMAGLLVLAYFRVVNSPRVSANSEADVVVSAVDEILLRDMSKNYPPSPKEVVKYYSELTKVLYNTELNDEQVEALAKRAMELYDPELAANQQWDRYLIDLKTEITAKKSQNYAIMSYSLSSSTDVTYFQKDEYECASLYVTYNIRNGSIPGSVEELFILRKDSDGHWRILGWDLPEE